MNISHPLQDLSFFQICFVFRALCIYTQQPFDVVAWVLVDKGASISWI